MNVENWFEYPVKVQPHHTDYGGVVWHGSYLTWMEEARVEYLHSIGLDYADLVSLGCDLIVVELSVRYSKSMRLGVKATVKTRIGEMKGVRIFCDYRIESPEGKDLYATARVTLVAVDSEKGKVMRQLPPLLEKTLTKLFS